MKLLKGNNREVCCMALFFSCLMVGLVVIAVWKRDYKKETIDNILSEGNKKEWLRFLFPMGLWIYDLLLKKQPAQSEEEREWANVIQLRMREKNPDFSMADCLGAVQVKASMKAAPIFYCFAGSGYEISCEQSRMY